MSLVSGVRIAFGSASTQIRYGKHQFDRGREMKVKTMAAALIIALGSGGVQATTINLGTLGVIPVNGVSTVTGSFSDTFNFDVVNPYNWVGGNIANLPVAFFVGDLFNITGLTVTFYDTYNAGGSMLGTYTGSSYFAPTGLMPAGDYSFVVSGTATGWSGGMYTYAAVAQPVPEPGTYGLLLAGLGLIGFMTRRRSSPLC